MKTRLSIGLPTYRREEVLIATLSRILELADPEQMEVIVADQTVEHGLAVQQQLDEWQASGRIRYFKLEKPSLPGARNFICREARGEIVLFLDDDVLLPEHFFQAHLDLYDDPGIGAVTGQVYNALDYLNPPDLARPREGSRPHSDVEEPCDANNISGGNHSVRLEAYRGVNGFDEHFVAAALGEDMDFSRRLMEAGYRIRYAPNAWIIHLACPSGGCGITGVRLWPEWTHSASLCLYAFRHGFKQRNFCHILWMAFRNGPGRKEILKSPWRWPAALGGWVRALFYGWRNRHILKGMR